jgi:hypothetical protein
MAARTGRGNSPQRGIRGPSDDVWAAVAARAKENGETRNGALVRLLEEYAAGKHRPRSRRARSEAHFLDADS